jgi:hypothetical protein
MGVEKYMAHHKSSTTIKIPKSKNSYRIQARFQVEPKSEFLVKDSVKKVDAIKFLDSLYLKLHSLYQMTQKLM